MPKCIYVCTDVMILREVTRLGWLSYIAKATTHQNTSDDNIENCEVECIVPTVFESSFQRPQVRDGANVITGKIRPFAFHFVASA